MNTKTDKAQTSGKTKVPNKFPHRDFGQRLSQAADTNPHCPPPHHGRLQWIATQLEERFSINVTIESVRKWLSGETRPRIKTLHALAEVLTVDEAWLAIGQAPELQPRERAARNSQAEGVVNLLAGVIQMAGGHPAFPEEDSDTVDVYAIIKGAQYAFRAVSGETTEDGLRFTVPAKTDRQIVIGVIENPDHQFDFYEVLAETIESSTNRGGFVEVVVPKDAAESALKKVRTFGERL